LLAHERVTFSTEERTLASMKRLAYAALLVVGALGISACGSGANSAARSVPISVRSEYSIHVGQTRTFNRVRPGDTIGCLGRGDTIRLKVPRQSSGGNVYSNAWDKKLSLAVGPRDPRSPDHSHAIVTRCTSR
jgi:hypothetical protein